MVFTLQAWGNDENGFWQTTYTNLNQKELEALEVEITNKSGYEDHDVVIESWK